MVSFVYGGATRRFPSAKDYIKEQMENYIIGKNTGQEGFVQLIEDSIDDMEAKDENPKELIAELNSILDDLLENPIKPYLRANREALDSFLRRRPKNDKLMDKDNKMVEEGKLKSIEEGNPDFDANLVAQLSGTVISDIANVENKIQEKIAEHLRGIGAKKGAEPTLEIESEIRLKTSKTIQGEKVLSFAKGNNRGNRNAHSTLIFPDNDDMSELLNKAKDLIIEYTGAGVHIIRAKKGKAIIDSDIDTEGIKGAVKFPVSDIDKFMDKEDETYTIKDGMLLDYEYLDELGVKLYKWFKKNIASKNYFNLMVQDGALYQLLVEVSLVNSERNTGTLSQRVTDTMEETDEEGEVTRKIKDKYSKFTATKYRIPQAFAISADPKKDKMKGFDITEEAEYPLIPMKDYKIPKDIEYKEGEDTEEKREARNKIFNKLKQARQEIVAQYNELKSQTTEVEVDGNKYFLIYSDNKDAYNKAKKAYNRFGFGNNKIRTMAHSFFDEKFEMMKQEGESQFGNKALFASDFQGKERLMYAYIDRKDEPITEAEAKEIEEGDFRVVEEKYGTTSSGYYFLRKDLLKTGDRAKYVDELGLNEEHRADLYYFTLADDPDIKLPSILGSPQYASKKLLETIGIPYSRPIGATIPTRKITPAEGGTDSRRRLKSSRLYKQDESLEDISTEKKMTIKRWLRMYKANKDVAKIYVLVPELVDSTVSESSRLIEGDKFGETKYQASAFTAENLVTYDTESGNIEDVKEDTKLKDTELDMKVAYTVYLKKHATYNLSPIRNRGVNKAMKNHLDELGNRIIDIRETMEGY